VKRLNCEQRDALLTILRALGKLWDAGDTAEIVFDREIPTLSGEVLYLASRGGNVEDFTDEDLIVAFELGGEPRRERKKGTCNA
jgi:hypothetical protein